MLLCPYSKIIKDKRGRGKAVGCGKCEECLRKKRNEWTQRLVAEFRYSPCTKFCTLTYDDAHLPIEQVSEDKYKFVFSKRDIQLFCKRVRKFVKFRYFIVSEFGDSTQRPHYHALFFFPRYYHDKEIHLLIQMAWPNGWRIDVQDLRGIAGIRYVVKYLYKQQEDEKTFYLASRNPGIGSIYAEKFKKIHLDLYRNHVDNFDHFALDRMDRPNSVPLCRYLRDKLFPPGTLLHEQVIERIEKRSRNFREEEKFSFFQKYPDKDIYDFYKHERSLGYQQILNLKRKNNVNI